MLFLYGGGIVMATREEYSPAQRHIVKSKKLWEGGKTWRTTLYLERKKVPFCIPVFVLSFYSSLNVQVHPKNTLISASIQWISVGPSSVSIYLFHRWCFGRSCSDDPRVPWIKGRRRRWRWEPMIIELAWLRTNNNTSRRRSREREEEWQMCNGRRKVLVC